MGHLPARLSVWAAALVVVLWGLYVCFWNLGKENVGGDEATYVRAGWAYVHGNVTPNREHPPTAKYLFGIAQLIGGEGALAARVLVGLLVLGVAVAMFLLLARELGRLAACVAGALWLLTPRAIEGITRLDRVALLEPVMAAFAVLALLCMWCYSRRGAWWLLVLSGALMAASVTSKVTSVVLLPVVLATPLILGRARHWIRIVAVWIASFCFVAAALYLPMGLSAVTFMVQFQTDHARDGHLVEVAGQVYRFPPWWAELWFLYVGVGVISVALLVLGCLATVFTRSWRLLACLGAAFCTLFLFFALLSSVTLPHYYYVLMPFLILLGALGYDGLASRLPQWAAGMMLATGAIAVCVPAAQLSQEIWQVHLTGAAHVQGILSETGTPQGRIFATGMSPSAYYAYLQGVATRDLAQTPFVAILVGDDERYPPDPELIRLLAKHPESFNRYDLETMVLWIPTGELVFDGKALRVLPLPEGP